MTWGKGGSTNVVQVTTKSRRAASVPAEDLSYEPSVGSKTARAVWSALDHSNDLSLASKRQDRKLLDDIQLRMDQVVFSPSTKRESRPRARRGATTRARRASIASVTSLPVTRRTSGVDDEDYELVFPDRLIPKRLAPCARRAYHRGFFQRSASLPPSTDDVKTRVSKMSTVGSDFIGLGSPLLRVVDVIPPPRRRMTLPYLGAEPTSASEPEVADKPPERRYDYYHDDDAIWWPWPRLTPTTRKWWPASLTGRRFSFAFGDSDAGYTPQLRLARAYQFSHPRPYVRRHVPLSLPPRSYYHVYVPEVDYVPAPITSSFRAGSEPKKFLPSASLAVRQAKNSLSRIERELGMGTVSIDDAPYFEEPVVRTTHIAPVSAVRTGWFRGGAPVSRKTSYRSHSVAARPPPVPRSTRIHEIEARLETLLVPDPVVSPVSYSSLRSRAVEARNKLDQHKVLLDRYLPVPSGPVNEVPYEVEYKFSELAERMPQLRPRERSYRASSLPPVSSVSAPPSRPIVNQYNNALRRTPFKPTMSETRKRAREVLCRTKGDPHYFDY